MTLLFRGSRNGEIVREDDEAVGRNETGPSTEEAVSNKHVTILGEERLCERLCI
jgi:hypothetical protein